MKHCDVEGCRKRLLARGWCSMHYERWRRNGTTNDPRPPKKVDCLVVDCSDSPRSRWADYCEVHYYRLRRTGTTDDPQPPVSSKPCSVGDCADSAFDTRTEMCRKHSMRVHKHGDPRWEPRGENSFRWTGEDATYWAVHQRVRAAYGSASGRSCYSCGSPAAQWSYDRTDPDQLRSDDGAPYSLDLSRYRPMCVSCHKNFDMACIYGRIDPMDQEVAA